MFDVFSYQPNFIQADPVHNKTVRGSKAVLDTTSSLHRFEAWIPYSQAPGLSVLDLGCKIGALGGYVLAHGADRYVGVDNDPRMIRTAKDNFARYQAAANFELVLGTAEEYVAHTDERFDVVVLGRVLHRIETCVTLLKRLTEICDSIVIDEAQPITVPGEYPIMECGLDIENSSEIKFMYSIPFLVRLMEWWGWVPDYTPFDLLQQTMPEEYGTGCYDDQWGTKKYAIRFTRGKGGV